MILPYMKRSRFLPELELLRSSIVGGPPARVVFMHVPKCGGTSVKKAIERKYGYGRRWFGGRGILYLGARASKRAATAAGMTSDQFREHLLLFGMAHPGVRYISGHVPFSRRGYLEFGSTWNFVTILRDPVSKWFSQYFYNRYKPSDHSRVEEELEEFIETPIAAMYGSDYVRFLSSDVDDPTSKEAVDSALQNLRCFTVVGVLEDLDRFRDEFRRRLGFDIRVGMTNRNPVSAKQRKSRVTPELRQKVEQLCRPNLQIYEAVLEGAGRD